jgi:hypothetical protein
VTAANFRRQFDGEAMLARFRTDLIEPYRAKLQTFDPLSASNAYQRGQLTRSRVGENQLRVSGRAGR